MNTSLPPSRRRRAVLGMAAIASFSLLAAACGSDSDSNSDSAATTQPPVTTPETTESPMTTEMMDMVEPSGPGCTAVPADGAGSFAGMAQDPAATAASNNPLLSTLVSAVVKAGLVDTLNGEGPFTIFAPVNDAFAAIPADQLDAILADTEMLTKILTYHVIAGEQLSSADLIAAGTAVTVNGAELTFADDMGELTVNGAKTLCMDVHTANATVHIIDTVLVP